MILQLQAPFLQFQLTAVQYVISSRDDNSTALFCESTPKDRLVDESQAVSMDVGMQERWDLKRTTHMKPRNV